MDVITFLPQETLETKGEDIINSFTKEIKYITNIVAAKRIRIHFKTSSIFLVPLSPLSLFPTDSFKVPRLPAPLTSLFRPPAQAF